MDDTQSTDSAPEGRSARKRHAIMAAATELFLLNGYRGTSMDEIAARATASKQTVYKHFTDKEQLFTAIVRGVADNSDRITAAMTAILHGRPVTTADEVEGVLTELAHHYAEAVLRPPVLRLRRLVIAEADRFPELAREYYLRGPARAVALLSAELEAYAEAGLLRIEDPELAATQFAYLVIAPLQDRALFHPAGHDATDELDRFTTGAVRLFLDAHRPGGSPG